MTKREKLEKIWETKPEWSSGFFDGKIASINFQDTLSWGTIGGRSKSAVIEDHEKILNKLIVRANDYIDTIKNDPDLDINLVVNDTKDKIELRRSREIGDSYQGPAPHVKVIVKIKKSMKKNHESVIQQPFSNSTRNQPISGSYPLSRIQYEDADKRDKITPQLERIKRYTKDDFDVLSKMYRNALKGTSGVNSKIIDAMKDKLDALNGLKESSYEPIENNDEEVVYVVIDKFNKKRYGYGEGLSRAEANQLKRKLLKRNPNNFGYYSVKKIVEKTNESMRAREVNEDYMSDKYWQSKRDEEDAKYKQREKEMNAKYRAEDRARQETYKKMKKAYVLPIGAVSPANGNTMYDWNIYTSWPEGWAFLLKGFLIFSSHEDDFDIGEEVVLYGNDTGRRLTYAQKVIDKAPVIKEELVSMLYRNHYDYKPKRAFQKAAFSNKLSTSYSVKGITYDEIKPHKGK